MLFTVLLKSSGPRSGPGLAGFDLQNIGIEMTEDIPYHAEGRNFEFEKGSIMKRFLLIAIALSLGLPTKSVAEPATGNMQPLDSKLMEAIQAEVSNAPWHIKHSLPELKHVKSSFLSTAQTIELASADNQNLQILVMSAPSLSLSTDFVLAYLKNSKGEIVDWKSKWLCCREGQLGIRLFDVDDDGSKEFCFVCKAIDSPVRILSAYRVNEQRFEAVIVEYFSGFAVEFAETNLPNGLSLQPRLSGKKLWETGKLYEIPIRVLNKSHEDISLKNCSVWLSSEDMFSGGGAFGGFAVESLKPGEEVEVVIVVRFDERPPFRKITFGIHERPELP